MNPHLTQSARQRRLSGLLASLERRLQEARTHQLPHEQFLELVFQDELNVRQQRLLKKRKRQAGFRDPNKTLEDFDWTFNPAIKRQPVYELASCQFIRQRRDVLLIGPPGLGKSHWVQAIGYHALKAGFLVLYRSIAPPAPRRESKPTPPPPRSEPSAARARPYSPTPRTTSERRLRRWIR